MTENNQATMEEEMYGRPLQLLKLDEKSGALLSLDTSVLKEVFGSDDVKDLPVCVTSVMGAYRTGKSFLLNFLIRYLRNAASLDRIESDSQKWLGGKGVPLKGFDWKQGNERTTLGITVWSRPFVLEREGKKIAVVLMDTQGLFDQKAAPGDANTIVAISTLLSSLQVYNILAKIDEHHLTCLELFVETGMLVLSLDEGSPEGKPFQELLFLVRDWIDPKQFKFGIIGGKTYLQDKLKIDILANQPKELRMVRENIAKCYEEIKCCLLPHPGMKVVQTTDEEEIDSEEEEEEEFSGKIEDIERTFLKHMKNAIEEFYRVPPVKRCGPVEMTGSQMMDYCVKCFDAFEGEKIPKPESSRQAIIEQYNNMVLERIVGEHTTIFKELIESGIPTMDAEKKLIEETDESSRKKFDQLVKGNSEEIATFQKAFNKALNQLQRGLIDHCNNERLKLKKHKEETCRNVFVEAKSMYHEFMSQGSKDVDRHKLGAEHANAHFQENTEECEEERQTYMNQLQDFLNDRFQHYKEMENLSINSNEAKAQEILRRAKDRYSEKMDKMFCSREPPKSEDTFNKLHEEEKEKAMDFLKENLDELSIETASYMLELQTYLLDKAEKLRTLTRQLSSRHKEEAEASVQCAVYKGLDLYRDRMKMTCCLGSSYLSPAEFADTHFTNCAAAKEVFRQETNMYKEEQFNSIFKLDNALEHERHFFLSLNDKNDPTRVQRKIEKEEPKQSSRCSVQ